jgi:hypothetical protein
MRSDCTTLNSTHLAASLSVFTSFHGALVSRYWLVGVRKSCTMAWSARLYRHASICPRTMVTNSPRLRPGTTASGSLLAVPSITPA